MGSKSPLRHFVVPLVQVSQLLYAGLELYDLQPVSTMMIKETARHAHLVSIRGPYVILLSFEFCLGSGKLLNLVLEGLDLCRVNTVVL